MKKILLTLGLIIAAQSAYAINPESVIGRSWVRRSVTTCVKEIVMDDIWTVEFAYKYCSCTMSKFVAEMSLEELTAYGNDDPTVEAKADKLLDEFGNKCLKQLSE